MSLVSTLLRASLTIPDRRPIWEWAAANVDFGAAEGFKGRYNVDNVPWTREPLDALANPYVREETFIGPPQESGKTIMAEIWTAYRSCVQPGKMAWNTTTNVKADAFSDTRWQQLVGYCRALKARFSDNRHDKKKRRIVFRDRTFLLIQGAETDDNRQSDSIEAQVNDEVHLWEHTWLTQMHSRLRAFRDTRKILNISIGGTEDSELHERFQVGTQKEWTHHCPGCGSPFQYVFDQRSERCNIRFELEKAVMLPGGRLDLREFEKTIHVACLKPGCGHQLRYDRALLAKLNRAGVYTAMNPTPDPGIESFHINAFAIGRRPWVEILTPWVRMNLKTGIFNAHQLRVFINEELAEFWKDKPMMVRQDLVLGAYKRADMAKPGMWPEERLRVMSIDNQEGGKGDIPHRWFVVRAFAADGRSRLVDCGRINEWADVRKKQLELGVPVWAPDKPAPWVVVDRAHDPTAVDKICHLYKWFGMLGQDNDEFIHGKDSRFPGCRMYFSEERLIDTGYGTKDQGRLFTPYFLWSSQKVQDLLAQLRTGNAEAWEVPSDIMEFCPEYADHINSHRQIQEDLPKGGTRLVWRKIGGHPDHLYDCESMIVVQALLAEVFQQPTEAVPPP